MEFEDVVVKENPGLCRCCLSEGCYKDLSKEYTWMNDTEVYADMLMDCFDISISQHNEGPNGPNRLICEVCITRLRDACNFKKQVLDSEKKFVDMIGRGDFANVTVYETPMKRERPSDDTYTEEVEVEFLDEDMNLDDEPSNAEYLDSEDEASADDMPIAALQAKVKAKKTSKPKKVVKVEKAKTKPKSVKVEEKPNTSKATSKGDLLDEDTEANIAKLRAQNLKILINHTSVVPFEWDKDFSCFFCKSKRKYTTYPTFLEHVFDYHVPCRVSEHQVLPYVNKTVNVDVSVVACNICDGVYEDLREIIAHLIVKHDKNYERSVKMLIKPYSLADLLCVYCDVKANTVAELFDHMKLMHSGKRKKAKNIKVEPGCSKPVFHCDYCDNTFDNKTILTKHISESHKDLKRSSKTIQANIYSFLSMTTAVPFRYFKSTMTCLYCLKDFQSHLQWQEHIPEHDLYAEQKVIPSNQSQIYIDISVLSCKSCTESFDDVNKIIDHIVDVHNAEYDKSITDVLQPFKFTANGIICVFCQMEFLNMTIVIKHVNEEHIDKTFLCSFCGKKFTKRKTLNSHIELHHRTNNTVCKFCNKEFDDRNKLRCHLDKEHRNYPCEKCDQSFSRHYKLQQHLVTAHAIGHSCAQCGKLFPKLSTLTDHFRRIHLKDKQLQCTLCDKKFFRRLHLKTHIGKHIGTKSFPCSMCDKAFLWKKNLDQHLTKIHKIPKIINLSETAMDLGQSQ